MDEGINTFTEFVMVDRKYGAFLEFPPGIGFTDEDVNRAQTALTQDHDPILADSWKYATENSYGRNSYPPAGHDDPADPHPPRRGDVLARLPRLRGALALRPPDVRGLLRRRCARPETRSSRSSSGRRGTGAAGWTSRSSTRARRPDDGFTGFDDADKPVNFDPDPKKKPKKKPDEKKHKGPWQSLVVVGRDGDIEMPADVVLTFKDGQTVKRTWDGASGWIKYRVTSSSPLVKAEVDPERRTVLDRNPWNNARYTKKYEGPSAAAKGRTYALHLVEILLSTLWGVL